MKQGQGITHHHGIKDGERTLVSILRVLLSSQALVLHSHEGGKQHIEYASIGGVCRKILGTRAADLPPLLHQHKHHGSWPDTGPSAKDKDSCSVVNQLYAIHKNLCPDRPK